MELQGGSRLGSRITERVDGRVRNYRVTIVPKLQKCGITDTPNKGKRQPQLGSSKSSPCESVIEN